MNCPQEPIPAGWQVWRTAVPLELTQLAMDVRDHVRSYAYGTIARTVIYNGQTVGVFVSHHEWTYRGGQLITGICIPGCSLIVQTGGNVGGALDELSTPDPAAAVYGADDVLGPPQSTDWALVAGAAAAAALVVVAFFAAIHVTGTAAVGR